MKNSPLLLLPALLLALFSPACKDKCDTGDFGITSLQPSANPAGYEIFIEAKGVTANTRVRFDEVDAASVKTAEGGLIVKVPTGVSGPVSLSIEEGSCSDSRSFEVLGTYPGNVPAGPTTIIVPQAPGSLPSDIGNQWKNVFDVDHSVGLFDFVNNNDNNIFESDGILDTGVGFEFHNNIPALNSNPVSGHYNIQANDFFVVIDRTSKPGGYKDTLTGSLIPNLPQSPTAVRTILLKSKRTGRQLALFREY